MAFLLPKTTIVDTEVFVAEEPEPERAANGAVTCQLYLKPHKNSESLDKDVVLRRIRHRKRVNRVRSVMRSLLTPPESKGNSPTARHEDLWLDDAFSAP
ncbi:hypothetical protein H6P81_020977 [Aristolochia fimbriata]|uniref:Uncharacterized protein n=1 Tax=Aristolochia fimbriata TaxID=158543 RepID=A0AAV7DW00_ARIFI|nr:hypothetical protein H6P81_020977 [Aristolochia fimbriata]